jgi:DNA-binding PucR family transcriptional regulator
MTSRSSGVAVLCADEVDWEQLRTAVQAHLGNRTRCRLGVGALCVQPADFPRSYTQAQLALKLQFSAGWPPQVTVFDNLGIYQLLSEIADVGSVESFVQQWLGALLDYDDIRHGRLVETLSQYLESGGHYDTAAKALSLHRNTLRYRLRRIRELSGFDLSDPDVRFNLQLATRAWTTSAAMRG